MVKGDGRRVFVENEGGKDKEQSEGERGDDHDRYVARQVAPERGGKCNLTDDCILFAEARAAASRGVSGSREKYS